MKSLPERKYLWNSKSEIFAGADRFFRHKKQKTPHTDFMNREAKESMRRIVRILGITVLVYVSIRWLFPLVIPFLTAFLLAKLLNPLVEKLENKLKLKRSVWSSLLVGLLLLLLGLALYFFVKTLAVQIKNVIDNLELYKKQAGELWRECCFQIENITGIKAEMIQDGVQKQIPEMMNRMKTNAVPTVMSGTILYAKNMFVFLGVCFIVVISTILILKDYGKMRETLEHHPVGNMALKICRRTYEAGGAYIKSQIIIMCIITVICVLGLFFSGNEYALLTGCGIGICDAMPFLGTGTIFVPWAIIELIQGRYMLAAIYTIIYTVCSLMREILEPKLLGNKLGMHPLAVIVSMYVGLKIYGLWGFALGPLTYILIKEIYYETLLDNPGQLS